MQPASATPPRRSKVLVLAGSAADRRAVRAALEPAGVDVVEASGRAEAVAAVQARGFAAVLVDVDLPGEDPQETVVALRRAMGTATAPVVLLARDRSQLRRAGAGAAAADVVLKPLEPAALRSKVEVLVDLDRRGRELAHTDELATAAFEAAPSGMAVCDRDGVILQVNPAMSDLAGDRAVPGARVLDLLAPTDARRLGDLLDQIAAPGVTVPRRTSWLGTIAGPGGSPIPVYLIATVVRDHHGAATQLHLTARDERDREIATTLQRALLPERLPVVPGLSVSAHVSAGGHGTQVGGDWYDAIALPGGRLGIVVGDVAGRGIEAAARMGELRSVARAYALEGHDAVGLVERMNGYHAALGADLMTTLVYAVFEIDSGSLRIVNAGHPPPVVRLSGAAEPQLLDGAGPPLGVMDTWRYEERIVQLPAGAVALLYTDGLVERRDEPLDAGLERLRAVLGAEQGDITTLCGRLFEAMDARGADDDVTCVAIRVEPTLGPVANLRLGPDSRSLVLLRRVLHRWLREAGAQRDEASELVMAANEAWQNALEHGTGFARTTVDVDLELAGGEEVVVRVRDAGRREREPSDPDRGRGIELMRALADEVRMEFAMYGSVVELRRRLRAPAGKAAARAGALDRVAPRRA